MRLYLAAAKNQNAPPNNITSYINYNKFIKGVHAFIISKFDKWALDLLRVFIGK